MTLVCLTELTNTLSPLCNSSRIQFASYFGVDSVCDGCYIFIFGVIQCVYRQVVLADILLAESNLE